MHRLSWLGAGMILAAAILAAAAPMPALAQTVWCCCTPDISQCVDRQATDDCPPPPPFAPKFIQHVNDSEYYPSCSTVQNCDELVSCVASIQASESCPPIDPDDPAGPTSCPPAAPGAAAPAQPEQPKPPPTRPSWVTSVLGEELIPDECRVGPQKKDRPCTVRHLLQVVVNITRLMLGVMGSLALLMFTYGGLVWLTSAGNTERVSRGKTILTNAVFGILILLVSWSAVNLLVVALSQGRGGLGEIGQIFSKPWIQGP